MSHILHSHVMPSGHCGVAHWKSNNMFLLLSIFSPPILFCLSLKAASVQCEAIFCGGANSITNNFGNIWRWVMLCRSLSINIYWIWGWGDIEYLWIITTRGSTTNDAVQAEFNRKLILKFAFVCNIGMFTFIVAWDFNMSTCLQSHGRKIS